MKEREKNLGEHGGFSSLYPKLFQTSLLRRRFRAGYSSFCLFAPRLRAVSYFSLQSYCTRNLSTRVAKPRAA